MKKLIILVCFISGLIFLMSACGGGSSASDSTQAITLDSSTEGRAGTFSALLLSDTEVGGTPTNTTGIVLIHGRGGNPDTAVVRQLRKDLYARGYMTLSIQAAFPAAGTSFQNYIDDVNNANESFPETYARVREAINELESRGATDVVLIGFSMGSRMVSAHMENGQLNELPVIGMVGVGMYATSIDPLNMQFTLDSVTVPVLDIYGHVDTNAVNTAAARVAAYGGAGADYTQTVLTCPDGVVGNDCHKLVGLKGSSTSPLETRVANWFSGL